ncbi:protein SGT1 homolog A-like isoform X3 [Nymphaea colorata]|uniref:protein SGT1 homolog A-like isoform X3 n=1 Tax=Nymphaea colorata TaxID=210225 RepID=UPI00129DB4F5|nr:protein SGT1 homolog A-like isoform X3 [Nymphaea colorata]
MADELEKKAAGAFVDDNFELACDLYSQAIDMDPTNADFFANRAQANIKLKRYTEAVADANRAIELDPSMAKAYLRKGTACIQLEEFETAMEALKKGASLDPKNMKFGDLIEECDKGIADGTNTANGHDVRHGYNHTSSEVSVPKPKYRHEYYQKPDQVVLTIFAKGISSEYIKIDFGEQLLSVIIEVPNEEIFCFQPRLFAKILPQRCRCTILSTKIEIRLFKADESINWTSLEYKGGVSTSQRLHSLSVETRPRPAYPSSKSKGTDWDKLEAEVKREEKDEKLEGDAALNKLFRDIYQNADEDTRRAMKKSFVESNGTVLSTNWKDVGSKTVEGSAPDGMEMKKWEY